MKFLAIHTLPPNAITREQADQISEASQHDPLVHGYRSFVNLSEGKAVCILEAPDRAAVAEWCQKMGLPYDAICPVEIEGDRGHMTDVTQEYGAGLQA